MPKLTKKMKELVTANMRQAILEASREIIIRDGLEHLTMEKLAQEAEISTGSIYNYFANKEAIVGGIMEDAFMNMLKNVTAISEEKTSAKQRLIRIANFMLEDFQEIRLLHNALMKTRPPLKKEKFMENHAKLLNAVSSPISDGIKEGSFRELELPLASSIFLGMIREIQFDPGMRFTDIPPERLANDIIDIFIGGISKPRE